MPTDITPEMRATWQRLCEEATPGPWEWSDGTLMANGWIVIDYALDDIPDGAFIAAARTALPLLLAALAEREAGVADYRCAANNIADLLGVKHGEFVSDRIVQLQVATAQLTEAREKLALAEVQRDAARAIVAHDLPTLSRCTDVGGFAAIMGVEYDVYQAVKMEKRDVETRLTEAQAEIERLRVEVGETMLVVEQQDRTLTSVHAVVEGLVAALERAEAFAANPKHWNIGNALNVVATIHAALTRARTLLGAARDAAEREK